MSPNLFKRLETLERLQPAGDPEQHRKLKATIEAIFATVSAGCGDMPSELEELAGRVNIQTTTEADRALMESWPKCHIEPAQLVVEIAGVRDLF